jgi:hypothetical protein
MLTNFRNNFGRLAGALVDEHKYDSAKKVMDHCLNKIDNETIAYEFTVLPFIRNYYRIGEKEEAKRHLEILLNNLDQEMFYYANLGDKGAAFSRDIRRNMYMIKRLSDLAGQNGQDKLKDRLLETYDKYMRKLEENLRRMRG